MTLIKRTNVKPLSQLLLEITPDASDRKVASMLGDFMTESERQPYKFSINHDIRPPKNLRCPLRYDWAVKDRVGINTTDKPTARRWIAEACLAGYQVQRENGEPLLTCSLAIARRRAAFHQLPKLPHAPEDDIPF